MNALEAAGIEFLAGNGAGPGVRLRHATDEREHFLAFLRLFDHRLRGIGRHARPLPVFGFALELDRQGATLRFRDQKLGRVWWDKGAIHFDPPLPNRTIPTLTDETFNDWLDMFREWVSRADYRSVTGIQVRQSP